MDSQTTWRFVDKQHLPIQLRNTILKHCDKAHVIQCLSLLRNISPNKSCSQCYRTCMNLHIESNSISKLQQYQKISKKSYLYVASGICSLCLDLVSISVYIQVEFSWELLIFARRISSYNIHHPGGLACFISVGLDQEMKIELLYLKCSTWQTWIDNIYQPRILHTHVSHV